MAFISRTHGHRMGSCVGTGQCVALVQHTAGVPHTSKWRRGALVRGGDHPAGTAIATFSSTGRYANHVDGRSHAAIFLEETPEGIRVCDQWHGQACHTRLIRYKAGKGLPVDDGDAYYVIEVA